MKKSTVRKHINNFQGPHRINIGHIKWFYKVYCLLHFITFHIEIKDRGMIARCVTVTYVLFHFTVTLIMANLRHGRVTVSRSSH